MEPKPDPRIAALPDIHGHAKGEHKAFAEERPIPYTARMLFLWFFHACRRSSPRFLMVADHMNYLTFEDPAAVNLVRRALKLAQAGDLYGAAETAGVELGHAAVVSEGLRRGMRYSIGAEIDNDPRCRPDAQNIVDAMKPDGMIRSIHFLPITHPQHGEHWMWAFDNPEFKDLYDVVGAANVWDIYMTTLLDAIDKLPGNIVGHFYVPAKFGHWPDDDVLASYEDRFVAACAERGMAIEVNSRYFYKYYVDDAAQTARYRNAHVRLLRKAKAAGVMIAVGSDAHSPKDQGHAFDTVLDVLDEAEINEIAFPIGGRLARVALRATEEILREHSAALAPPVVERPAPVPQFDDSAPTLPAEPVAAEPVPVVAAAATVADEPAEPPAAVQPRRPRPKPTERTLPVASPDADAGEPARAPEPKKRSHKKSAVADAARGAVDALAEAVTAVAAKAVHAVADAVKPHAAPQPPATVREAKSGQATSARIGPAARPKATARAERAGRAEVPATPATPPARTSAAKALAKPAAGTKAKAVPAAKRAPAKPAKPVKAARADAKSAADVKPSRTKSAPAKPVKKTPATAPARAGAVKKSAARPAARAAAKAPAKRAAPPKKPAAKTAKRSAPVKATPAKKSAGKKTVAKKKSSRARR
ncbi:MAG: hypothetical protein NVSMB19_07420 [Vulcanimicrobiaceae bacterium]